MHAPFRLTVYSERLGASWVAHMAQSPEERYAELADAARALLDVEDAYNALFARASTSAERSEVIQRDGARPGSSRTRIGADLMRVRRWIRRSAEGPLEGASKGPEKGS